jgi:hypothetical protein
MIYQSFKHFFAAGFGALVMSGCVMYELGEPPPGDTQVWQKLGNSNSDVYSALLSCEKKSSGTTNREYLEARQLCMLRAGYKFVNWRAPHTFCKAGEKDPWAWNTPACRSLRGELVIPPDESASSLPPFSNEDIQPKTSATPISIAPSASPVQRLQEKTQKDSNTQMNQLLQPLGNRK